MNKSELRKQFLAQRKAIPSEQKAEWDAWLADALIKVLDEQDIRVLHTFVPIEKFAEVNVLDSLKSWQLSHEERALVIPKVAQHQMEMSHFLWTPDLSWEESAWGIKEPKEGKLANLHLIDAVLTPLLSIDEEGQRVGYGKGYYDAFFTQTPSKALKIGIGYFPPVERIDDLHPSDVPLDMYIYPGQVLRMTK